MGLFDFIRKSKEEEKATLDSAGWLQYRQIGTKFIIK